jgi:acetyltransferase-like isoleucine patch superfamily enzyme
VTRDVASNAVVAGAPARVLRMRETPAELHWS